MTMTTGSVQLPPRLAAPAPQVAPPVQQRTRRIDRVTIALLVGVGASAAFAGMSALALAALASLG
ncbi:hypothetical protein [Agrococcus jejuensis]|uniref:Uncharacterized protein n=1 Tax=Agrococcus jejuensis TaxID=399736 RepID=A0A1G8EI69_9MICO|nr:hypothetical protein [Agrococcus jejuensis]SDH69623.1 hypothetical protein SAMN04489720_2054 [Agrococcus jejuensis]